MSYLDPMFAYLATLSVVQPGRIQEIELNVPVLFGELGRTLVSEGLINKVHEAARNANYVVAVRKGVYSLSERGSELVRSEPVAWQLDNRRLFLMKSERRRILR